IVGSALRALHRQMLNSSSSALASVQVGGVEALGEAPVNCVTTVAARGSRIDAGRLAHTLEGTIANPRRGDTRSNIDLPALALHPSDRRDMIGASLLLADPRRTSRIVNDGQRTQSR